MTRTPIKQKNGLCPECGDGVVKPLIGKLCKARHYWQSRNKAAPLKRTPLPKATKRINKVADKRKVLNAEYTPKMRAFLEANPVCAIKMWDICTGEAQGVHHVRGKIGQYLLNEKHWLPACNACNSEMENKDKWARENGFKQSKHLKPDE